MSGREAEAPSAVQSAGGKEDTEGHCNTPAPNVADRGARGEPEGLPGGDTAAALDFLQQWCPGGPWVLSAISPEGGNPATATFTD